MRLYICRRTDEKWAEALKRYCSGSCHKNYTDTEDETGTGWARRICL